MYLRASTVLVQLGASTDIPHPRKNILQRGPNCYISIKGGYQGFKDRFLDISKDENAAYETRYEVYFSVSLTSQLLFELERNSHIPRISTIILE
jgi:hypothetical protein